MFADRPGQPGLDELDQPVGSASATRAPTFSHWLANRHWGVRAALAILAGVLTALGFEPFGAWPLVIPGVAGLTLAVLAARRLRGAAGLGFAFGVGFLLLGVGWMQVIFLQAMLGLVLVEALFYAVLGAAIKLASRTAWWPLLAAACWTGIEFAYSRFPFSGFGWMRLGYAMVDSPLAAMLPLVGVATLGFSTAMAGQLLAWLVLSPSKQRTALVASGVAGIAVLALGGLLVPAGLQTGTTSVGYVQGGAPGGGVYGLGEARTITRNQAAETARFADQMSETDRLADDVDTGTRPPPAFIVWPENGTDMDPFLDAETNRLVQAALDRAGVPILVGAILEGPGKDERRTASLWWDPEAGVQGTYIKRGIVPFGEWVPFRSILLPLIPELQYVGAQSIPGTAPGVLPVTLADGTALKLGILVCYDLVYDDFAYDTVRAGGQVQIVQSSNAMYQGTGQIEQQFAITRVRALELRREMLVVTTSGVSGLINPDGSVAFTEPDHVSASGVVELPTREGVTPAAWGASWIELTITLLAVVGLGLSLRYGRMDVEVTQLGEANGLPGRS